MAKTLVTFTGKCYSANKNNRGAALQFSRNTQPTADGKTVSREVVVFNVEDPELVNQFKVVDKDGKGPDYTITISQ